MNIAELRTSKRECERRLDLARNISRMNDEFLKIATPGTDSHVELLNTKTELSRAIANYESELQSTGNAIHAMEEATKNGARIEAIEQEVVDLLQCSSVVIAVGHDPDDPESVFIESFMRPRRKAVCPHETAKLLRDLADQLEAHHSHDRKDH